MFGLFSNQSRDRMIDEMLKRSERMERYYLDKAIEYAKYAGSAIDVDAMVVKFNDDIIGEFDSATINTIADDRAKDYRKGIEDVLKAIRGK